MGHLNYDLGLKTTFWIIVICYLTILATLFVRKSFKSEEISSQKNLNRAIAIFFYMYVIARILFIFSDFERDPNGQTALYFQFVAASYVFNVVGFLALIIVGEKYLFKPGKFVMSYILGGALVFNIVLLIFFPQLFTIARYINYVIFYTEVGILILLFLFLIRKTPGKLRKNSIFSLIGLIVMSVASILESDALVSEGIVQPYYSPFLFAIGITIFAYGQMKGI
ncbi:MAG: hypothetical protein R6U96_00490 [Promethearchaeia archaeon]